MDKKIYMIRHGKIDEGAEKRYIGVTDLPLCNEGIEQAGRLKEYFSGIDIEKAYSSPLIRCVQTSEIILDGRNVAKQLIDELKEIDMGEWEGESFSYIKNRFPELYEKRGRHIDTFNPPGGESFYQVQKRVLPVFENIIGNSDGNVMIITHAGVIRVILSKLLGSPLNEIFNVHQPYGCVNKLFRDGLHRKWKCETILPG